MNSSLKKLGYDLLFIVGGLTQILIFVLMINNFYEYTNDEYNLYLEVQTEVDYQKTSATFINKYGQIKYKPYGLSIETHYKIKVLKQMFIQLFILIPLIPALILLFYITLAQISKFASRRNLCLFIIGILYLLSLILINWIKIQNKNFSASELFLTLIDLIMIGIMLFFMSLQSNLKVKYD